jgi:hypothetical protein
MTTSSPLSTTAYSIYLQLLSFHVLGPSLPPANLKMCHAMVTRGSHNMETKERMKFPNKFRNSDIEKGRSLTRRLIKYNGWEGLRWIEKTGGSS